MSPTRRRSGFEPASAPGRERFLAPDEPAGETRNELRSVYVISPRRANASNDYRLNGKNAVDRGDRISFQTAEGWTGRGNLAR